MKNYENKVVECLNSQHNEIILNSDINHAGILIKQMFLNAVNTVNLLSNKLDANLYERDEIINAIHSFLSRNGTTLNVAIEGDIDIKSVRLKKMFGDFNITPVVVPQWLKKQYKYNFLTIDNTGFRFESDRKKHEAIVNFGDVNQTNKFNEIFNRITYLA